MVVFLLLLSEKLRYQTTSYTQVTDGKCSCLINLNGIEIEMGWNYLAFGFRGRIFPPSGVPPWWLILPSSHVDGPRQNHLQQEPTILRAALEGDDPSPQKKPFHDFEELKQLQTHWIHFCLFEHRQRSSSAWPFKIKKKCTENLLLAFSMTREE